MGSGASIGLMQGTAPMSGRTGWQNTVQKPAMLAESSKLTIHPI